MFESTLSNSGSECGLSHVFAAKQYEAAAP